MINTKNNIFHMTYIIKSYILFIFIEVKIWKFRSQPENEYAKWENWCKVAYGES